MNPALSALFLRSLREDARNRRTYWTRAMLGGVMLLVLFQAGVAIIWAGAPGRDFLASIIFLQMAAITFLGLSYFTSAITEEKEEQMLGLLRMTDLNSLSILLGKSTSRLCGALLLLTAQIPFTIFAVTLGGVSLRQVAAVYCTLAAYTFFLCNLALLGSVLARRTAGAAVFCLAMMALLLCAAPLLGFMHDSLSGMEFLRSVCARASAAIHEAMPIARLEEALETGFAGPPFGWQVVSNLAAGCGCFFLAWALFGRFCDRGSDGASAVDGTTAGLFGRQWSRPPRAWRSALLWKDFYFLCGGRIGFALRLLAYGAVVVALLSEAVRGVLAARFCLGIAFLFSLELAVMASRVFRVELNEQTLAGLAVLPCGMEQIARAKSRACLLAAVPGAIATITTHLVLIDRDATTQSASRDGVWILIFFLFSYWIAAMVLVHVVAWLSLHMKRGALPVGYLITFVTSLFVFGFAGGLVSVMLQPTIAGPSWWERALIAFLPALFAGIITVGPALGIRGLIPHDLAQLAGES